MAWVHRLSDINENEKTGLCAECGPVFLLRNGKFWKCRNKSREDDRPRQRNKKLAIYGLDTDSYNELLRVQNGVCAICSAPPSDKNLAVDHCHKTGKVRGLLCSSCNTGLGLFKDNPELLTKAGDYLK